ncbi:MAG: hypothetical protein QN135_04290 [Armatimonadota bacterium]|nr:hypothetical protein [Armatimonadota bacterium]
MRVHVLDPDLLSSTRLRDQIRRAGWTPADDRGRPDVVIVNLARVSPGAVASVRARWAEAVVVGFCGHADHPRREAGLAAGCDAVIPHGEAMNRLIRAVARLASEERGA